MSKLCQRRNYRSREVLQEIRTRRSDLIKQLSTEQDNLKGQLKSAVNTKRQLVLTAIICSVKWRMCPILEKVQVRELTSKERNHMACGQHRGAFQSPLKVLHCSELREDLMRTGRHRSPSKLTPRRRNSIWRCRWADQSSRWTDHVSSNGFLPGVCLQEGELLARLGSLPPEAQRVEATFSCVVPSCSLSL